MRYQEVRSAAETALQTAFGALTPAVPVFFDNITAAPANSTTEYVTVNLSFGLTTEVALQGNLDNIRGTIVLRVYSEKGKGPARNQTLINTAHTTLLGLSASTKAATGIYFRVGSVNGPSFSTTDQAPHLVGQIDMPFTAEDNG